MKFILYGVKTEENFGGPSILHGARELIKHIDDRAEVTFFQWDEINVEITKDLDLNICQIPYENNVKLLKDVFKYKFVPIPAHSAS